MTRMQKLEEANIVVQKMQIGNANYDGVTYSWQPATGLSNASIGNVPSANESGRRLRAGNTHHALVKRQDDGDNADIVAGDEAAQREHNDARDCAAPIVWRQVV